MKWFPIDYAKHLENRPQCQVYKHSRKDVLDTIDL